MHVIDFYSHGDARMIIIDGEVIAVKYNDVNIINISINYADHFRKYYDYDFFQNFCKYLDIHFTNWQDLYFNHVSQNIQLVDPADLLF